MILFKDFSETKIETLEIYQFKANVMLQYFRACIWWKYLDEHSVLPPPYTAFYFMIMGAQYLSHSIALKLSSFRTRSASHAAKDTSIESPIQRREREHQELLAVDKREFHKRLNLLSLDDIIILLS